MNEWKLKSAILIGYAPSGAAISRVESSSVGVESSERFGRLVALSSLLAHPENY